MPAPAETITLATPLARTGLVTARQAGQLAALGLTNVGKLLAHLPLRHERHEAESAIAELVAGAIGSARGEVTIAREVRRGKPRIEAAIMDHTGRLDVVWFNQPYRKDQVVPGVRVRVEGKVTRRLGGKQMVNPRLEVLAPARDEPGERGGRIRPVYPASEEVHSTTIEKAVKAVLEKGLPLIEDHLPAEFLVKRAMPGLAESYRMQHAPGDEAEVGASRRRLAYDELLLLQLGVHLKRAHLRQLLRAPALRMSEAIDGRIRKRFPFAFTPSQDRVVKELTRDLTSATPTNRLIQGDVGSGKTAVALYAMLMAVAGGHQASLMAPTEILAEQHSAGIERLLRGSQVRLALLTGSTSKAERESVVEKVRAGEIDLLIGTHSLISESVKFKSLAVAIIDEQHRFGVSQRATLRARGTDERLTPHVIVMTATPIPRTLALTLFGDLDISTIDELPPGRRPVATRVLSMAQRRGAYEELARRVAAGEQGFVVVPAVEAGEDFAPGAAGPLLDVGTVQRAVEETYLKGRRVAVLHAQLPRATREAVMERFRLGQIDVLVATTVIEVGVDVPNATMMIVEQADRFGLAQLHQLRGRVGRGEKPSACVLISDPVTPDGAMRLKVMEDTRDGFVLAEHDLTLRGMGEVFGLKQSGLPPFRVASLPGDRDLLDMARRDAAGWIARSPTLTEPGEALLLRRLMKTHGRFLGLGDVG